MQERHVGHPANQGREADPSSRHRESGRIRRGCARDDTQRRSAPCGDGGSRKPKTPRFASRGGRRAGHPQRPEVRPSARSNYVRAQQAALVRHAKTSRWDPANLRGPRWREFRCVEVQKRGIVRELEVQIGNSGIYRTMRRDNTTDQTPPSAELQLAGLIAKLEPKNQKLVKTMRRVLRKRFPTVNELVYDYTKSLVISYSPNERGSDGIVAMSADANGVRLFFNQGVSLPDPHSILLGDGHQTRYIRIEASKVLLRPEVESLLTAAVSNVTFPLARSGRGELIIKSSKQRTRKVAR